MRRLAFVLAAVALLAGACRPETVGQPQGDLKLTATFDDAQDLRIGHPVQVSGVTVGTVTNVKLDGYRARVTMAIESGRRISRRAVAVLTRTSLLGEHIVDLRVPEGVDTSTAGYFHRGDDIGATRVDPDLEQVAEQSIAFLDVFSADDVATIIDAGVEAFGGRGETLNRVIADLSKIVGGVSAQRGVITAAVDGLGRLGTVLNANSQAALTLLDDLSAIARVVDTDRHKFVATADQLGRFAASANAVVGPNAERIRTLLTHLDAILGTVVANRASLEKLFTDQLTFVEKIPKAIRNGQLLAFGWFVRSEGNAARPDVFSLVAPTQVNQ